MSTPAADPSEPPRRRPSQGDPEAGPGPAAGRAPGQPTPHQPYDQQTPWSYRHPGQPAAGYPQPGSLPPGYPPQGLVPVSPSDEKLWALLSHLSIPFFGFVVPLVVYLVFRDRSRWLKDSALEALNFSILYTIAITASAILTVALIGLLLLPLVWVLAVVLCLLAAVAANRHELYRYPLNWRLVT
ncbi:MAG: hypothetical protein AVDCRST_MAG61-509 [uncultured Friedmanniella sp.]|uniref:DUF4870 domain-containing protein n=1 Tax=uncultured Friedmanniella sp. TaxID=335381 RepID=A0A6J4K1F5_9ACTN|nr:DUF4870 domain-containing protein [uncultured Friedmanniella sp.]CAA9293334.1 MAG: hypothetical protein AVDCRST_MAG61-509 [uncultured Friedmanniella sp.]